MDIFTSGIHWTKAEIFELLVLTQDTELSWYDIGKKLNRGAAACKYRYELVCKVAELLDVPTPCIEESLPKEVQDIFNTPEIPERGKVMENPPVHKTFNGRVFKGKAANVVNTLAPEEIATIYHKYMNGITKESLAIHLGVNPITIQVWSSVITRLVLGMDVKGTFKALRRAACYIQENNLVTVE
jgi:hypothetical protein